MKMVTELKKELESNIKGYIESIKDEVYYVEYTKDNIDELLQALVEYGYQVGEDIWQSNQFFHHLLVDHSIKKVQLIQGNWLRYVEELNYPIHPVATLIELLPFHE
jgi:hypothetical protein